MMSSGSVLFFVRKKAEEMIRRRRERSELKSIETGKKKLKKKILTEIVPLKKQREASIAASTASSPLSRPPWRSTSRRCSARRRTGSTCVERERETERENGILQSTAAAAAVAASSTSSLSFDLLPSSLSHLLSPFLYPTTVPVLLQDRRLQARGPLLAGPQQALGLAHGAPAQPLAEPGGRGSSPGCRRRGRHGFTSSAAEAPDPRRGAPCPGRL